jgi:hypothetical protein
MTHPSSRKCSLNARVPATVNVVLHKLDRTYRAPIGRPPVGVLADPKDLERENATLKRLLAEAELEKAALKEIARGNF